eukprot:1144516-Prymnesium_polylepis.1
MQHMAGLVGPKHPEGAAYKRAIHSHFLPGGAEQDILEVRIEADVGSRENTVGSSVLAAEAESVSVGADAVRVTAKSGIEAAVTAARRSSMGSR